ncbi:hypothetical protein D7003_15940 [Arthrobacter oryzae]|uniref:DUF222 domain-containing protein n=1 Tax=Arthrobacter oryzae TaxID=409290 RepID=A0A3N0BRE4_9MICC|nr:hypothetical protein D7003_15940 [Arthrobacter oryzae]
MGSYRIQIRISPIWTGFLCWPGPSLRPCCQTPHFFEASNFAGHVEDLSRTVDFLQLVAAAAVDRTRKAAALAQKATAGWGAEPWSGADAGWLTGWTQEPKSEPDGGSGGAIEAKFADAPGKGTNGVAEVLGEGDRNPADFLRARLRSAHPRPNAGLPSRPKSCPGRASRACPSPRHGRRSPQPWPPGISPRTPRRSSQCPWTGSGTRPGRRPLPGWNMP